MTKYVTRFAPSPTGNLHLGSFRTALINYIVSKKNEKSKFHLRIEDTDKIRSKEEYKRNIINCLNWLEIHWDSKIQIQSKRFKRHLEIADLLLKIKKAYKCICTEDELNKKREELKNNKLSTKKICTKCKHDESIQSKKSEYIIRINIPEEGKTTINDKIQGDITVNNKEIDEYVLVRKDGTPTYMLSVVVDDHDLGVNYIIRGDDHLNNIFRQNFIYKYMNWKIPIYAHLPLVHGKDGSKLSKRHGAIDILQLRDKGYTKESIINNLILLGWSPKKADNEIISLEEIINKFEIEEIKKSSSIFNYNKLNFFNNYYLRLEKNIYLFENFCTMNLKLNNYYKKDRNKLLKIFDVYKKNLNYFEEINNIANVYFEENLEYDLNENFGEDFNYIFPDFKKLIQDVEDWNFQNIDNLIKNFTAEKKLKFQMIGKPLRHILINSYIGPSIIEIFMILGKKNTIDRLNKYIID